MRGQFEIWIYSPKILLQLQSRLSSKSRPNSCSNVVNGTVLWWSSDLFGIVSLPILIVHHSNWMILIHRFSTVSAVFTPWIYLILLKRTIALVALIPCINIITTVTNSSNTFFFLPIHSLTCRYPHHRLQRQQMIIQCAIQPTTAATAIIIKVQPISCMIANLKLTLFIWLTPTGLGFLGRHFSLAYAPAASDNILRLPFGCRDCE